MRERKRPAINVTDITLVLEPRAQKEWISGVEKPQNDIKKGAKVPAKRAFNKKHLIHQKIYKKRVVSFKYNKK